MSRNVLEIFGYETDELKDIDDIWPKIHPDDLDRIKSEFGTVYESAGAKIKSKFRVEKKNGEYAFIQFVASNKTDNPLINGILVNCSDITEEEQAREKVEYLSYHDELTGLYNRRFFMEELNRLDVKRQWPLAILMLDIDGLKRINDTLGHLDGDKLIIQMAEILKQVFREEDIIARVGGDEFMVILPKISDDNLKNIFERLEKYRDQSGDGLQFSFGASVKKDKEDDLGIIMGTADNNMYQNKMIRKVMAINLDHRRNIDGLHNL
jgi:diguanylate cyclase (GGDEF)-like protein/PAS domain S-box-containing protein